MRAKSSLVGAAQLLRILNTTKRFVNKNGELPSRGYERIPPIPLPLFSMKLYNKGCSIHFNEIPLSNLLNWKSITDPADTSKPLFCAGHDKVRVCYRKTWGISNDAVNTTHRASKSLSFRPKSFSVGRQICIVRDTSLRQEENSRRLGSFPKS